MTEATYQSAADCPLGQAHGTASTHGNAKGETCCDFCGFPVDPVTDPTPVAMEVWRKAADQSDAAWAQYHGHVSSERLIELCDQAAAAVIATALAERDEEINLKAAFIEVTINNCAAKDQQISELSERVEALEGALERGIEALSQEQFHPDDPDCELCETRAFMLQALSDKTQEKNGDSHPTPDAV